MMKKLMFIGGLFISVTGLSQKGDELLVYSMKGNVMVIENNKESKAKIGKVLKPGTSIKTQKLAKLTMVCKQGKPISLTREGVFPVARWKDSCSMSNTSVTSKYFQYIWDQLYVRSEEYKKEHPDELMSVSKNDAPVRGQEELEITTNEQLDTINYGGGEFKLSWSTNMDYSGRYQFILYQNKTGKILYKDSVTGNHIAIEPFKKFMQAGNTYSWSVAAPHTDITNGGIIRYVSAGMAVQQVRKWQRLVDIPEDRAAQYFRTAYLLANNHYFADAYAYYQKAAKEAPEVEFYQEELNKFRKTFLLQPF